MAIKQNPFNTIYDEDVKKVATNKINPFNTIASNDTPVTTKTTVETPLEVKPQRSILNTMAKVVLPKKAEDFFGLNGQTEISPVAKGIKKVVTDVGKEIGRSILPTRDLPAGLGVPEFLQTDLQKIESKALKQVTDAAILPVLNHPAVQPVLTEISRRTSGTGIYSMIQAAGPKTFTQAYEANRAYQAGDPSKMKQFLYQLGDTVPQTAIGVALNFAPWGTGKPLSTAYWTALSADEQIQKYGKVTSTVNLGVDVLLDRMLGKSIESIFKAPAKSLVSTLAQNFTIEGGTEVAQDLLKMANSYREAKTPEERAQILQEAKEYFTSGQILMTAGVGGLSGAFTAGGAYGINKTNINAGGSAINVVAPQQNSAPVREPKSISSDERQAGGQKDLVVSAAKEYNTPQEFENALLTEPIDSPIREQAMAEMYPILVDEINRRYNTNVTIEDVNNIYESKLLERFPQLKQPFNDGEFSKMASEAHKKFTEDLWKRSQAIPDAPLDTSKPIAELQQEYINNKPGYKKIAKKFDETVSIGTILPEDAIIFKTLFENNTKDEYLDLLNVETTKRKGGPNVSRLGRFTVPYEVIAGKNVYSDSKNKKNKLEILKNLVERDSLGTGISTVLHEFGHSGYYMILTDEERAIVDNVYKSIGGKQGAETLFKGSLDKNPKYHAKNVQEFFAQSFAEYIIQNRVPAQQMEPILKRVGKKFFEGLKRLVTRQNVEAINRLSPLFEKVLAGDKTTPLTEFANQEPPSFKNDLANMLNKMEMAEMNELPFETKPTKEVPVETMLPPTEDTPIDEMKTLQQQAVKGLPPDIASTIEPPEKVMEGSKRTPDVNKIGFFDKWTTPSIVMRRLGVYKEYKNLIKTYENYLKELPGNMERIKQWSKSVSKESNQRIFSYLDGEKIELTAEEMRVAGEIKNWLAQWADRLGMEQDARLSDYITHIFPRGKSGEIPEEIATLIRNKTAKSIYDPFLLHRQGAEGYIKDTWLALEAYVKRATRKVNIDPGLEEFNKATAHLTEASILEFIEKRISALNMRPTTLETDMDNQLRKFFPNIGPRPTMAITYYTRKMISAAKIAGSAVTFGKNLTQGINTFTELGGRYATSGYIQLAANRGKELKENSVIRDSFIEDRVATAKDRFVNKADQVMFLNMTSSELINRGAAYYGAKSKFLDGKITPKEYELAFGEKQPANYKPTEQDAIEYGKFVSEKTQFLFGPLETQHYVSGPIAKTMTQFSSYGLKQTEFMVQLIKNREYAKIARYIIGTPLFFQYIAGALGMSWKDSFLTFKWGLPPALKFIQALWDVGVKGEDKYGNKLTTSEKMKSLGSSFLTNVVPMGSQLKRSYEGYKAVDEGGVRSKSGKLQYRIDKTPMNYVKGTLFGKYNLEQSKAYYEKQEEKAKASAAKKSGTRSGKNPFDAQ